MATTFSEVYLSSIVADVSRNFSPPVDDRKLGFESSCCRLTPLLRNGWNVAAAVPKQANSERRTNATTRAVRAHLWVHQVHLSVECSPLVRSTEVISDIKSIFVWSQSESAILDYNTDASSARL